ncbi:MAG: hypothetical protein OXI26_02085 [bacterium]|nr:hypothetical protein [bacterium]
MRTLADAIAVGARFARSANLERDLARIEPLDGYIVTARVLDVVERIVTAAAGGRAGGAWSLTGPYGSGKSSLALLLDAALSGASQTHQVALQLIADASPDTADLLRDAHSRHGTQERGFHRALVTAERETVSRTMLRALHGAVLRSYGRIPSPGRFAAARLLRGALEDAQTDDPRRTGPSPSSLVEIACCLAQDAPLLLIVDEFGKNLEAIRDNDDSDPYLLQRLAEAGQGSGLPIFVLTLQHLSFEDYFEGVDAPQRREWAKVQGRFEDIAFVESASQTRALIGTAFSVADDDLRARIDHWAGLIATKMRLLGIHDIADQRVVASCYPLHPLVALVLPELCSRYGQHERTLFSFLTDPNPASVSSFLDTTLLPTCEPLPSMGLDAVYDYFVAAGAFSVASAHQSSRWTEIATRLRDSHGLTDAQQRLAKSIALLNLVSTTGAVRASRQVLALTHDQLDEPLTDLESAGIVTYRDFADEYRIWQGTDVDIRLLLESTRQRIQRQSLVEILRAIDAPGPVIAARHSAKHNVLRIFQRRYSDGGDRIEPVEAFSPHDGLVLLCVGKDQAVPDVVGSALASKPIVVAVPEDVSVLDAAAREVAAVTAALEDASVIPDWVARRELGERLAQSRVAFEDARATTFNSDGCRWLMFDAGRLRTLQAGRGSSALSAAAERAYPLTPMVRNEMINRSELTSQGAKARRILLEAMIEQGTESDLGLEGYGPQMAMYQAVLKHTGLHGRDSRNEVMTFRSPTDESLKPAWQVLTDEFQRAKSRRIDLSDIYAALLSPPIGMKAGVIPVFVTAGLLAFADEVAIYEHGTFMPVLTADASERMVRNPSHFQIKHFANTTGARREVVAALAERLEIRPRFRKHRVANVLAVVGQLVSRLTRLDNYTLCTSNLPPRVLRAREALTTAVEPDALLFASLPKALGFSAVSAEATSYPLAVAYADSLSSVLDDLDACYPRLLENLLTLLLETSAERSRLAVMGHAAGLDGEVLDPGVRAFVLALADNGSSDTEWVETIATVVAKKAPTEWTDQDLQRSKAELVQDIAAFQRLVALHTEQRSLRRRGFASSRVAFTWPDGDEYALLVAVDDDERRLVENALAELLENLGQHAFSLRRAQNALLAILGDRVRPARDMVPEEWVTDASVRGASHG